MRTDTIRALCVSLMKADSEEEVITLLKADGYWDKPEVWRFYGDNENNWSTIGNQQSRPDAALVEKIVNCIDARLMGQCLARGIDPKGTDAPRTIREAVALFFEGSNPASANTGRMRNWPAAERTEVARGTTLAVTGAKRKTCITICDDGEGQTPEDFPATLLSLHRSNKLCIPFVQGLYNMGGTGVLKFCGSHNLQLIISRRNPAIAERASERRPSDGLWGFTVVRREDPQADRRSSAYTYLAPVGADLTPNHGNVLAFKADELHIFPKAGKPYVRPSQWGTLIKLYEYASVGSHIFRKDGLLSRLDLLLPDIALPVRLHECRAYGGDERSFETTLTGIGVRLDENRAKNMEDGFPASAQMMISGQPLTVSIFAFRGQTAETYRKHEGVIFVVNGQTQAHLTTDFFVRPRLGLSYLAKAILVIVDCTRLAGRAREDLFMNSRDRLSSGTLRSAIEAELQDLLKNHDGLRALKEKRRREDLESKLEESKPLEETLKALLLRSHSLAALFLPGKRLPTPFKTKEVQAGERAFEGKRFPTFFKFKGKDYGATYGKDCHLNMRLRVFFETDAENDYFKREIDPGEFTLVLETGDGPLQVETYAIHPNNGIASLSVTLPYDAAEGDRLYYTSFVNDPSRVEPFENKFVVEVKPAIELPTGRPGPRRKPPTEEKGKERETPQGISFPEIKEVREEEWGSRGMDEFTALQIVNSGTETGAQPVFDFYVNVDNKYLRTEMKTSKTDAQLIRAQFTYGMVLLGLALIRESLTPHKENDSTSESGNGSEDNVEEKVAEFTRAVAPFLIPMINTLGELGEMEGEVTAYSAEEV